MKLKKGKFLGAIVLTLFLLSSCKSLKNSNTLFQSEYDKFADTAKSVYIVNLDTLSRNTLYKIKPFDIIAIRNLQNPEGFVSATVVEGVESGTIFHVDKDGIVDLPVVGRIQIQGLRRKDAAKKIQDAYSKSLFKNPIIELTIVNNKVTLLGEVSKPGNYQIERENYDLIELLGKSSGFMPSSNPKNIKIIRGDRKNPEIIYVNLTDVKTLASDKLILQNNDIVYVSQKRIYNTAEVLKTYGNVVQPTMLLFNALILIYTLRRL